MSATDSFVVIGLFALSVLTHFLPNRTRPDLFFGVTVGAAFRGSADAGRVLRNYRTALWSLSIVAGALAVVLHHPVTAAIVYLIGIVCLQVGTHRRVSVYATSRSTIIEVDFSAPEERIAGGPAVALLPFILLLALSLWALSHLDQLPNRLAIHWSFSGPDRWAVTSSRAVVGLLSQYALICLVLTASALGVLYWSRRISASGPPAASERRFRRRTVWLILTAEYFTILPPAFSLLQAPAFIMKAWSVALIVTIVAFIISLMHAGQGGTRLVPAGPTPIGDRTADNRWMGGLVYFNPTDPALLVEKRMGIGWTLNFGNPWSLVSAVVVAILIVGAPLTIWDESSLATGQLSPRTSPALPENQTASPGTAESLRRYIVALEQGHANHEEMSPQLASAVNRQLPRIMATINGLGTLSSLTYEGTDKVGADVYLAAFSRGRLEWHIGPLVEGKVTYRKFCPVL